MELWPPAMTPKPRRPAAPTRAGESKDMSGFFPEAAQDQAEGKTSTRVVCHLSQPSSGLTRGKLTVGGQEVWCQVGEGGNSSRRALRHQRDDKKAPEKYGNSLGHKAAGLVSPNLLGP